MSKGLTTNSLVNSADRTKYQIIRRTEHAPDTVEVGKREIKIAKNGAMVSDKGVAEEIFDRHHGKDLLVVPIEKQPEQGHRRTFRVQLPKNYKRGTA